MTKLELTVARVRLWWASDSLDAFCTAAGMDKSDARNWSADLRRREVLLKAMPNRKIRPAEEHLTRNEMAYLRRLSQAIANGGEDLTLEVFEHQEPEVVDAEETQRAERVEESKRAADRRRAKTSQASAWSSVNGADE